MTQLNYLFETTHAGIWNSKEELENLQNGGKVVFLPQEQNREMKIISNRQDHGGFEIQEKEQEVVSCQKRSSRRRRRRVPLLWRPPPAVKCWARKSQVTL